jgi:DNA-binding MarR family transcriptional regulator
MIRGTTPTDRLVEAIATRIRRMDLLAWQQVAAWAEESELSFEDLRLLLALAVKMDDGPAPISELAELAGFPLDVAYPSTHRLRGRGYLVEEGRQYSLSEQGRELVARLDAVHREGIQAYVDQLPAEERRLLETAFGMESSE